MLTTYEIAARNKKVAALVAVLRASGVSSSMARESDAEGWRIAAEQANVNPPKAKSIVLVIEKLEELER